MIETYELIRSSLRKKIEFLESIKPKGDSIITGLKKTHGIAIQ